MDSSGERLGRISWRFSLGTVLFATSYIQLGFSVFPRPLLGLSWLMFFAGVSLISDGTTLLISGHSLLTSLRASRSRIVAFILVTTLGTLMLEGGASWLGGLWFYPGVGVTRYAMIFIPGGAFYLLMIAESYLATKALIDLFRRGRKVVRDSYASDGKLYEDLGLIGLLLSVAGLALMAVDSQSQADHHVHFRYILTLFFGVWFILEFLQYYQKKTSLLRDLLHQYPSPLLAIFVASILLGVTVETLNGAHLAWSYTNWPFPFLRIMGTPIVVLIAWVMHYIIFLSLFRALTKQESDEVWRGDVIE